MKNQQLVEQNLNYSIEVKHALEDDLTLKDLVGCVIHKMLVIKMLFFIGFIDFRPINVQIQTRFGLSRICPLSALSLFSTAAALSRAQIQKYSTRQPEVL